GEGLTNLGDFKEIPWSDNDIWMEVAIKRGNKSDFTIIADSRLFSVPYAFHSNTASRISGSALDDDSVLDKRKFPGVPSSAWSVKGNTKTNDDVDKLGTTDPAGLSIVTNDVERIEVTTDSVRIKLPSKFEEPSTLTEIIVEGDANFNTKNGETISHGNLTVENSSATALTGTLTVDGATTINEVTKLNGQVTINTLLDPDQNKYSSYPLQVEGSAQGVAIKVTDTDPGWDSNFLTFFNGDGEPVGRIEGGTKLGRQIVMDIIEAIQTRQSSIVIDGFSYAFNQTEDLKGLYSKHIEPNKEFFVGYAERTMEVWKVGGKLIINVITAAATVCIEDCDDPFAELWSLIFAAAKRKAYLAKHLYKTAKGGGVVFESGGADYAEWLKKADPDEIITYGEVVGLKDGLISKTFTEADQFMAITSNPLIVGAMPQTGKENNYEKVALMGQVPILVMGETKMGDYILPSGKGDGIGISVDPKEIMASEYSKMIGVAWSASENGKPLSYINTAVGFNSNQMGMMVNQMQSVINMMQNELVKLNPDYKPIYFRTNQGPVETPKNKGANLALKKQELEILLAMLESNSIDEQTVERLFGNVKSDLETALSAAADCGDGDDWVLGNLKCWVSDIIANWDNFPREGINVNDNVVLNLILESTFFSRLVNNRFTQNGIDKLFDELDLDDFEFDPDLQDIISSIRDGELLVNLSEQGPLAPGSLATVYDNTLGRINTLKDILEIMNE
ncbi:MAG: hypothetical protein R3213_08000, partial [Flavobacteriaceae bacterium]|nr:hypothetical protein [Flavobacteriaceae bacterium]